MITLRLPYPPSINNYWLASGHRRFISERGKKFKKAVAEYVLIKKVQSFGSVPLEISIWIQPRSKVLMDIDNCIKPILDAMQDAGMFDNDRQVHQVSITRGLVKKGGGGCIVVVEDACPSAMEGSP
jgi:crossover junction endodeoxyribonuclease RusA